MKGLKAPAVGLVVSAIIEGVSGGVAGQAPPALSQSTLNWEETRLSSVVGELQAEKSPVVVAVPQVCGLANTPRGPPSKRSLND